MYIKLGQYRLRQWLVAWCMSCLISPIPQPLVSGSFVFWRCLRLAMRPDCQHIYLQQIYPQNKLLLWDTLALHFIELSENMSRNRFGHSLITTTHNNESVQKDINTSGNLAWYACICELCMCQMLLYDLHMGQVMKLQLFCYLVMLSVDSKTR